MLRYAAVPLSCSLAFAVGCIDDSSANLTVAISNVLTVDPRTFLGTVHCGPPELVRYVVTVYDVSGDASTIPNTSPPTPCAYPVSFEAPPLVLDDFFIAEIDGYDRDDIMPKMGAEGAREMVDVATMQTVLPRWKTTCGEAGPDASTSYLRLPTQLLGGVESVFHGCLPLGAAPPPEADGGSPDGQPDAAPDQSEPPDAPTDEAGD